MTNWDDLSKEEKDKRIGIYAKNLLDYPNLSIKDYELLISQIEDGKIGLLGGGDDIPKEERIEILNIFINAEKNIYKEKEEAYKSKTGVVYGYRN